MDDSSDIKPVLEDAKNAAETAVSGFNRLRALLAAIQRLASGTDSAIADLAAAGVDIATEFANEARSLSDEYARLISNA
ncbi:hypothetical protein BURK_001695 [Burkholderia sp. SJ98]|nr:hypothetical protein BURK_001695 [Burkholderia sp. SJ98]